MTPFLLPRPPEKPRIGTVHTSQGTGSKTGSLRTMRACEVSARWDEYLLVQAWRPWSQDRVETVSGLAFWKGIMEKNGTEMCNTCWVPAQSLPSGAYEGMGAGEWGGDVASC